MSSTDNNCNSRHFSWLMKSCFPNTTQPPHHPIPTTTAITTTTICCLPDDLLIECLSRVANSSLPCLPLVCSRWSHLLDSSSFHLLRSHNNLLTLTLFALSIYDSTLFTARYSFTPQQHSLWNIASFQNGTFQNGTLLYSLFSHSRVSAIGRKIYVIGRNLMLRYDTWTGNVVPRQGPIFPRKKFATAAIAGKIYVAGGCAAVEEYDPVTDSWRVVSHAPRKRYGCVGAAVDGVFYIIGGLKIGGGGGTSGSVAARGADAVHVYASSMDLYDVGNGNWLRSRAVPGGGCVVAACAATGHVYVLSSHAVELSFWKFNGSRTSSSNKFGEWCRIKSPPLPAQVRLDSTVRFSCVGMGDKVVLIQVNGCIDDLLRRSGRIERGMKEGLVLVYDCATEEWSRGADLPEVIRRAACVCVEC